MVDKCISIIFVLSLSDGLNSSAESNVLGSVKQEPLSDDECQSEDGDNEHFDGDHDEFYDEENFVNSKFGFSFRTTNKQKSIQSPLRSFRYYFITLFKPFISISGDYDGSDNEYDEDNNEYDNSESRNYGAQHWERRNHPDLSNVKEEKVCVIFLSVTFFQQKKKKFNEKNSDLVHSRITRNHHKRPPSVRLPIWKNIMTITMTICSME